MFKNLLNQIGFGKKAQPAPNKEPSTPNPYLAPIDVTDADFNSVVLQSEQPVIVDVWAEWCQPCQVISVYVAMLAKDYAGRLLVTALDADENPVTTEQFNILGLPTLLFLHKGKEKQRIVGVVGYEDIKQAVESLLQN